MKLENDDVGKKRCGCRLPMREAAWESSATNSKLSCSAFFSHAHSTTLVSPDWRASYVRFQSLTFSESHGSYKNKHSTNTHHSCWSAK